MERFALLPVLVFLFGSGCASHMNSDLLQARVRDQALQLTESQREIAQARSDLSKSQLEIERMKSELASLQHDSGDPDSLPKSDSNRSLASHINKLHIYSMASGGLNRDNRPGDDAVAVQFAPMDREGNPLKIPGDLEIALIDPRLPESEREVGQWSFSADECEKQWTHGIASKGYQFTVPLDHPADHSNLVVQLRYTSADSREFRASRIVKVSPASAESKSNRRMARNEPIPETEGVIEDVPPAGIFSDDENEAVFSDSDLEEPDTTQARRKPDLKASTRSEAPLRDSTNWTEATIPLIR